MSGEALTRCLCGGRVRRDPVDGYEVCEKCGYAQ